jgi:broad specificity phosphatase PhoE
MNWKKWICGITFVCAGMSQAFAEEDLLKTRFLYVRHGEVPGNDPNPATYIYTGCGTDASLTERGRAQAEKCAMTVAKLQQSGEFGKITAIYASTLQRAIQTAEPIARDLGFYIQLRHDLREISWGYADGELVQKMTEEHKALEEQVKHQYPERKIRWDHLPVFEGAETYNALLRRTLTELKNIAELHRGETVLIIGHGRVLKTLIAEAKDSEEKIPYPANCGIAEFSYSPDEGLRFIKVLENTP